MHKLGASTAFQVLQAGRDLAIAESGLLSATTAYEKARVELDRVTGATLTRNGIELQDAQSGIVQTLPRIPGIVPREESSR
jgi:outer membrane protein TolC